MVRKVLLGLAILGWGLACSSRDRGSQSTTGPSLTDHDDPSSAGAQGLAGASGASTAAAGNASVAGAGTNASGAGASRGVGAVSTSACAVADPFLKASGTVLRNDRGAGDLVALRGANLGGWLVAEPFMTPMGDMTDDYTLHRVLRERFGEDRKTELLRTFQEAWLQSGDFDDVAAFGMNAVRIPFSYLHMQNEDGSLRPDAFDRLDFAVEEAWKRCIYVVLDLHHAWGSASTWASGGRVGPAELFTNEENQRRTEQLWSAVAEHYRGNPAIAGYDLINEPAGNENTTNEERWLLQDRLYRAVRAADPDHVVFIEAIWWLKDLPRPTQFGWTNVVYECHHYAWDSTNDVGAQQAGADAKVSDFLGSSHYDVPLYLGEFNFFGLGQAWRYGIEKWDAAGLSWATWSLRAAVDGSSDTNSWGVLNPRDSRPAEPNLNHDSADEIASKWSAWGHGAFARNPMLSDALAMPRVALDSYETSPAAALHVPPPGVLENDGHLDSSRAKSLGVELASPPRHGTLALQSDGSFSYQPEPGFTGDDAFSYSAFDGRLHAASMGVVRIAVR